MARKDYDVLAALAAHPNLDSDLDQRLAVVEAAKVRSKWIARPGRKADAVMEMVKKERRSGALTALASMDLPEEAYRLIVGRAKSVPPLIALASNTSVPLDIRQEAVGALGTLNWASQHKHSSAVKALIATTPELADAFATWSSEPVLMKVLAASETLSGAAIDNIVAVGVRRGIEEGLKGLQSSSSTSYGGWRYNSIIGESLDVAHALAANQTIGRDIRESLTAFLQTALDGVKMEKSNEARLAKTITALCGDGESGGNTLAAAIQSARSTDDQTTIATLVARAVTDREANIAMALITNPNMEIDDLARVVGIVGWEHRDGLLNRFANDPDRLAVLLCSVSYMLSDEALARSSDPQAVLLRLAKHSSNSRAVIAFITTSRYMTSQTAGLLPVRALGHESEMSVEVRRALQQRISERLGESPARWQTFESMFANFSGSIDELLDVCEAIDK
jgi:hypothetical protein